MVVPATPIPPAQYDTAQYDTVQYDTVQYDTARRDTIADLARRIAPVVPAGQRLVDVHPALRGVWPDGIVRGSVVGCSGGAAVSLAALLAAAPSATGSWVAVVGVGGFGAAAASELGVALERVVHIRGLAEAGPDTRAAALSAVVDGFDVVLVDESLVDQPSLARRLVRRAQTRGVLLVTVDVPGRHDAAPSPAGAVPVDARLRGEQTWYGLDRGAGVLRARRVELLLGGRRIGRSRRDSIWCPTPDGRVCREEAIRCDAPR